MAPKKIKPSGTAVRSVASFFNRPAAPSQDDPGPPSTLSAEPSTGTSRGEPVGTEDETTSSSDNESEPAAANVSGAKKKEYKFKRDWLAIFPWLVFENDRMYCTFCRGQRSRSTFARKGSVIFKKDSVRKHGRSDRHVKCRENHLLHTNRPETTVRAGIDRQVDNSRTEEKRQMKIKMNIAYHIAKRELPFTEFHHQMVLHKKNGVDINPTYDNHVRCAEMIGQVADLLKESLAAKLKTAHYLAIMIDGDTDISNKECEIVYVRLLDGGKPVNILVGQQEVKHAHAIGVLDAVKAAFKAVCPEDGEWMKKLISFGADGAAVNMGHRGGVIALLKDEAGQYIIAIHCMPHRLELAILTIQKKEPLVAQVYDLLHLIWKTYHFSPKSKRDLCRIGEELGVDICSPSTVKGTRWIPHVHRALKVLLRHGAEDLATDHGQYAVVLQHMEHLAVAGSVEIGGRAKKIMREMEDALFCVFCHFLCDMFEELSTLSLPLQRNDLILPQATSELRKTVSRLEGLKSRAKPGGMLHKIQTMLTQQQDECRFQGIPLKGSVTGLQDSTHPRLKKHIDAAISIGVAELKARFGPLLLDEEKGPLDSFKVFIHDAWPEDLDSLLTFGEDEIADLMGTFREPLERSGCDLAAVREEWSGLKMMVSQNFLDKSYTGLWQTMLTKEPYCQDYKNVLELVQLMLVLPISAAQCERGFSAQNRIKNSKRSSLAVSTTEDLMRITLEGPSVEDYDPSPAVNRWIDSAKRARRPDYKALWKTEILSV